MSKETRIFSDLWRIRWFTVIALLLITACSKEAEAPGTSDPGPAEPAVQQPAPTPPDPEVVATVQSIDQASQDSLEGSHWEMAALLEVDGTLATIGRGGAELDDEGLPLHMAMAYELPGDTFHVITYRGRTYFGSEGGTTPWLDLTDPIGDVPVAFDPRVLFDGDEGYKDLRSLESGGESFDIKARTGNIIQFDPRAIMGTRDEVWRDETGTVRRWISAMRLYTDGRALTIYYIADRVDNSTLPSGSMSRLMAAERNPVPAASAVRAIAGTPRTTSMDTQRSARLTQAVLDLLVPTAHAQRFIWSVGQDIGSDVIDNIKGDLAERIEKEFWDNLPPPGAGLQEVLDTLTAATVHSIEDYFTPEQVKSLAKDALKTALKKVMERGLIAYAPYLGYYGLAGMLVGFVIDELPGIIEALTRGDPHIRSFDGNRYGFQATGEFVYLKTAGFEIQQRFLGDKGMNTAARRTAVRSGNNVIESDVASGDGSRSRVQVVINGEPHKVDVNGISLDDGTFIWRPSDRPNVSVVTVVEPGGSAVRIENFSSSQNVVFSLTDEMSRQVTGGLGGLPDGEPGNDFTLRDGTALALSDADSIGGLYGKFAGSWRVRPEERLFSDGSADQYLTAEFTDLPVAIARLEDFDSQEIAAADHTCRAAGVAEGDLLEDCTYDVLVTGDPAWADAAAITRAVNLMALNQPPAAEPGEPVQIELSAGLSSAPDGGVQWTLIRHDDEEVIVPESTEAEISLTLVPGTYDVLVTAGEANGELTMVVTEEGGQRFDLALEASGDLVVLNAPDSVSAGAVMQFEWKGPASDGDLIFISTTTMGENRYPTANRHKASVQEPARLVAPSEPGEYEIRYFSSANGTVLYRQPLQVTEAQVVIESPAQVPAGNEFTAKWSGPGAKGDGIFVATPDMSDNQFFRGSLYHSVEDGPEANLIAPLEPGEYEIRYFSRSNAEPIFRQPLTVLPPVVTIDAPRTITRGTEFEFSWQGPNAKGDFLFIAEPDMPSEQYWVGRGHRTDKGASGSFTAPAEAGTYEIRYFSQRNGGMLAKRVLVVR